MRESTAQAAARVLYVAAAGLLVWLVVRCWPEQPPVDPLRSQPIGTLTARALSVPESPQAGAPRVPEVPPTLAAQASGLPGAVSPDPRLAAGPFDPVSETEAQFRARMFCRLLAQFDGEPLDRPEWPGFDRQKLAPILLVTSVAAHLDAVGRGESVTGDDVRTTEQQGVFDHAFTFNDRSYQFRSGEFPAWDQWIALSRLDPATQAPFGIEPEPAREFSYPQEFFQAASTFGHQALALCQ